MTKEIKGKIANAFDQGKLAEVQKKLSKEAVSGLNSRDYFEKLDTIDAALKNPPPVDVPEGFVKAVLGRLPSVSRGKLKTLFWHDFMLPVFIFVAIILSLIFAKPLGLHGLAEFTSNVLKSSREINFGLAFIVISSVGILLTLYLIVTSFFGIRSRRVIRR